VRKYLYYGRGEMFHGEEFSSEEHVGFSLTPDWLSLLSDLPNW
jgi:hypothetical protein